MPAIEVTITAQTSSRMKLRWMPMVPGSAEERTFTFVAKKKSEANQPTT